MKIFDRLISEEIRTLIERLKIIPGHDSSYFLTEKILRNYPINPVERYALRRAMREVQRRIMCAEIMDAVINGSAHPDRARIFSKEYTYDTAVRNIDYGVAQNNIARNHIQTDTLGDLLRQKLERSIQSTKEAVQQR